MKKLNLINILTITILVNSGVLSLNANEQKQHANSNSQQNADQNAEQSTEKITVTGSRIKGVDVQGTTPVIILDSEDIIRSGATSLAELMQQVSQTRGGSGSFSTAESGATSTSTPAGHAAVSLRGMGPSSTLTLVNGRRIAASSFAAGTENFVDTNAIPLAAIDRVEVLATGASAIYGADAVAGVINYILRDDYQGLELSVTASNSFASTDEGKTNLNIIYGDQIGEGQLMLFVDHYDRNGFSAADRDVTRDPLLTSNYSYLPKGSPNIYYNSTKDGKEIASPHCTTPLVTTEYDEQICAYYHNQDDILLSPLESTSVGGTYQLDFEDISWKTDFFITRTESVSQSSPAPINRIDDSDGPYVDESALFGLDADVQDALFDNMYIDRFLSEAGQELYGFMFSARFNDPRTVEIETDSYRLLSMLQGDWMDWEWETAITLSKSSADLVATHGVYNRYRYHAALAGELCSDASIANYDAENDSLACQTGTLLPMYNPFVVGDQANEAVLAVAQAMPTRNGTSTVYGWDANISGDWFEFNDETVSAAFGFDIRKEKITDMSSANARADLSKKYLVDVFGYGSSVSSAERQQWGIFGEIHAPLTTNLEMQLAVRYDDYDQFGDTVNTTLGFSYRPNTQWLLRASMASSFRAPSLTQAGVELRTTRARYDCGANQAVADLYCDGQPTESGVNVLEYGNPDLQAEKSDSLSIGIGWSPNDNSTITLDYWSFDHNRLVDTNLTGVLAASIHDSSLRHCGLVPEGEFGISYDEYLCDYTDSAGLTIEQDGANLTEILSEWIDGEQPRDDVLPLYRDHIIQLENTGDQKVSGVDFKFVHYFKFNAHDFSLKLDGTRYLEYERDIAGTTRTEDLIGTWRYPQTFVNLSFDWSKDNIYAGFKVKYIDNYQDDIIGLKDRQKQELVDLGVLEAEEDQRDVNAWTTVNLYFGYEFKDFELDLSVNNIFDRDPPIAYGSGRGFDSINHNANGATWRLAFRYFFK